jgi:ABC-type transport system involved in multi-copper enzyme maturation permease subunit
LFLGPVFTREAVTLPRRPRHYLYRALYVTVLLLLMCTAWLVVAGTQVISNVGDMARFGSILFQRLAPFQLALVLFFSAMGTAAAVAQEKDRRTLILLLLTRVSNSELVLGKMMASLLNVLAMIAAAVPLFMLITLFGGVSFGQVARVVGVTVASALVAGSLGSTIALWRDKTFQTLSMTVLIIVMWIGFWEGVNWAFGDRVLGSLTGSAWSAMFSPLQAVMAAGRPSLESWTFVDFLTNPSTTFILASLGITTILNLVAIARVRVWNPSRELRPARVEDEHATIWGAEHDWAAAETAEEARQSHVDARTRKSEAETRRVWDHPILWREVCTWAYGRKVMIIRLVYLLLFVMAAVSLHWIVAQQADAPSTGEVAAIIPLAAQPTAPFFLVSLVIVNALAVTSITNERDGQALDLLLVTDLSPKEFVLGKLGGVLWVTKEMVLLPLVMCIYLWAVDVVSLETLLFLLVGLIVMNIFVASLGIHCGMTYANSRSAIGVSLGTVFFLFLGVVTCMIIMISFSGNFQNQLAPFLAFILGGGVGLYVSLGIRNPSPAIGLASLLLPFATFFAITSFLLRNQELTVFLVITAAYGFTTAAMLVPAVYEFDIAMGRTKTAEED